MTMIAITQNTPVLVAIDIAKARHEVLIAVPGKKRGRGFASDGSMPPYFDLYL